MDTARINLSPTFRFDAETHTYWLGDRWLPNISWILEEMGYKKNNPMATDGHLYRGSYVHWCVRLLNEGDLDWNDIDPAYSGYVQAYARLVQDRGIKPIRVETPLYHPQLFFAGTPDVVCQSDLWELKTGEVLPWVALQTALQEMLERAWEGGRRRRWGVQLYADGTYAKPVEFKNWALDESVARNLVAAVNSRSFYGIKHFTNGN